MATFVLRQSTRTWRGVRPLDPRRDLPQVADLIEEAFAGELDLGGQAALREMRLAGRLGVWMTPSHLLGGEWPENFGGFVWVEDDRVVGNVTVQRSDSFARRWQIANVAVASAYRRRGIARALMETALEHVRAQGGTWVVLQVRADNTAARRLYERLGFDAIAGTCDLLRPRAGWEALPATPDGGPPLALLTAYEWREVYELATVALPAMALWWQPLRPYRFRIAIEQQIGEWLGRLVGWSRTWRLGWREQGQLRVALSVRAERWRGPHRLEIWIHPTCRGRWEAALIGQALRRLATYPSHAVSVQIDADNQPLIEALQTAGFQARRTLITMRRLVNPE